MHRVMVVALSGDLVQQVAERMRAEDRAEVMALAGPGADVAALAQEQAEASRWGAVVLAADGEPVAAMGAREAAPGTYGLWLVATDRWPEVWRTALRWVAEHLGPTMRAAGVARVQCLAGFDRDPARRLLDRLGFRPAFVVYALEAPRA